MDAVLYGFVGFLFVFFHLTGWELERTGNILWTAGHTALILGLSLILGIVAGQGIRFLFLFLDKKNGKREKLNLSQDEKKGRGIPFLWLISFILILLSRLIHFIAFYPGICAYDMNVQLGQVESGEYNLHHPLAHTLFLKAALDFGTEVLHNPTAGIACMVGVQILSLSAVMAFGIVFLYRRGVKRGWLIFLQAFWMLYPFYAYLNVSVTKDVIFTVFFLAQYIALTALIRGEGHWGYDILFIVATVLMQLFRNNGMYAFLVLEAVLVLCFLFCRKERKFYGRLVLEGAVGLLCGALCLGGLTKVTHALQGDKREMLSVPIQQMARAMLYHGGVGELSEDDASMPEKDRALINDFLLYESYRQYDEKLSDPVKGNTNTYVVRYRTGDFLKTYFSLLLRYPGDMVNAFLALNAGYVYMGDESHGRIYELRGLPGLSYVHTRWDGNVERYGIQRSDRFQKIRDGLTEWANENGHLKIPVLKYLFVPALPFWGMIFLALYCVHGKRYRSLLPMTLAAGYYITLFLGPAVQLRYLFPLLVVFPFAACAVQILKD